MLDLQRHRGPDADGLFDDAHAVLGHRRLAIIDLSPDARQPMANEDGTVWTVFNGEIYNYPELRAELVRAGHTFRTQSDTEVLVHGYEQWGVDGLVTRLRGMFGFALYDQKAAAGGRGDAYLFLVRDRLGIKPLYYRRTEDGLAFASEVRALRQAGDEVDWEALAGFLALGSIPFPRTWLRQVACLPPGHVAAYGPRGLAIRRYWDLAYEPAEMARNGELPHLFADTVRRHLMSDVPLGVFLSGGLDSAGVAAAASRFRDAELFTLTVVFDEQEFTEAAEARAFAAAFHTRHQEVRLTDRDFLDALPQILRVLDQPTNDGVNTYFVSRAARALGLTVVLSGLGGDEVFLGYPHYRRLGLPGGALRRYAEAPGWLRRWIERGAVRYGAWKGEERFQRFAWLREFPLSAGLYLLVRGFFPPEQAAALLGVAPAEVTEPVAASFAALGQGAAPAGVLEGVHYFETKRYLHDQLLRDADVFSMAHSLELRVPLLDHALVERCCRIPAAARLSAEVNKPQLLQAAGHPALEAAARRPKRGFTFPFAVWMRRHSEVLEQQALAGPALEPGAVRACWRQFRQGRLHWSRAWATTVVGALTAG